MSHFSVCVAIPAAELAGKGFSEGLIDTALSEIMAPYEECPQDLKYKEFEDKSEEAKKEYETDTIAAVRYPDGRIVKTTERVFDERFVVFENHIFARDEKAPNKRAETDESRALVYMPQVPVKQLYTFEQYCEDYCGYEQDTRGRWGYWRNPNAQWDWYSVGGGFGGRLLVRSEVVNYIPSEAKTDEAWYKLADGARMGDIAWAKMKEVLQTAAIAHYHKLVEAFETGDLSQISRFVTRKDDGIYGWPDYCLYKKGETQEEYLRRIGRSNDDQYLLSTFAYVDTDGVWHESGNMGWWGISTNNKDERNWNDEMQEFLGSLKEDDFLVILDCHI